VPSSQSHAFYPPAQAFFRFRCPCADCDGEFDLTTNVAQLAATTGRGSRTVTAQVHCAGTRARDRASGSGCPIELNYRIVAQSAP
jgi:hypothetical protein